MSRPILWIAGSAVLVLLTLGGLYALAPVDYEAPQPKFFLCFFLLLLFWIGLVSLIVSFNCWMIFIFSSVRRTIKFHLHRAIDWGHYEFRLNAKQSMVGPASTTKGEQ